MKQIIALLLFFTSTTLLAQSADEIFTNANTLYKEGKYKEAIKLYEDIVATKNVSSELYYNLGNTYYKLNNVAECIYNYEKSIQLDPLNQDAQNNLIIAKRLTIDRIEELPNSIFQKLNENFVQKFTYNTWAVAVVFLSFLASILFLMYYFSYTSSKKRFFFTISILSFILLVTTLIVTNYHYNESINTIEAIIFSERVSVKNEPNENANELFILHEGTKVKIVDTVDDWNKIKLVDGKTGWILKDEIKLFNFF